ncbi:Lrp/AsnC family transcriptional regulator [Ilumatobacter sp.]|uniref:Lrp/AsnC family transcriptional regulator n=1 Tax=Ilumatobacter sp. TaxID=1967498 RepID=UPI003752DBE1
MATDDDPVIDHIDRTILRTVQQSGRMSVKELAEITALSTSATSERLRRLERIGAILGYHAEVAPSVLVRPVDAMVGIKAEPSSDRSSIESWIHDQPSIVEAVHLTGPHDYMLRLRCTTTTELDDVLMAMKREGGVAEVETRIVLRSLAVDPATP